MGLFLFFFLFFSFFFQAEDGIRDRFTWLEFRRVLFRSSSSQTGVRSTCRLCNSKTSNCGKWSPSLGVRLMFCKPLHGLSIFRQDSGVLNVLITNTQYRVHIHSIIFIFIQFIFILATKFYYLCCLENLCIYITLLFINVKLNLFHVTDY